MQSAALNKQTNHGLPPIPRRPTEWRSFHMISASDSLPAASTAFRQWKDLTKLSDAGISNPSPPSDLDIQTLSSDQNSFSPPDMINQAAGPQLDGSTAADNPVRITCLTDDQLLAVVRIRPSCNLSVDPNMDPKKIRRIVSNRESAQRSRIKKLKYVAEMERKRKVLEAEIGHLTPKVAHFRNQNYWLEMENKKLSEEVSSRTTAKWLKDAEIEKHREEVNRLKRLHFAQQQQRKFREQVMVNGWAYGLEKMGQSPKFAEFNGPNQMGFVNSIQVARNGETSRPLEQCDEEAWNVDKNEETSNNPVALQYVVDEQQAWMTGRGGGGGWECSQKMSDLNLRSVSSEPIKLI